MIKFALIISVCSFLGQPVCLPPMEYPKHFNSWYECAKEAQTQSNLLMSKMGYEYVNKYRIAMNYSCKEVSST